MAARTDNRCASRFFVNELKLAYYENTNVYSDAEINPIVS